MTQTKGTVEKERVVCQNCRYHYSFLYDAKEATPSAQATLTGTLSNYRDPRESYRACPHCGYYQDWMLSARRKHHLKDMLLFCAVGACGVLLYLVYQMVAVAFDPLGTGGFGPLGRAEQVLMGYLGLMAVAVGGYWAYLHWLWNPNRDVDTQSYEAALPREVCPEEMTASATQYEAARRLAAEVELPRRRFENPWARLSWTKRIFIIVGVFLGAASLMAPAVSPELALALARRGMTMFPFYLGVTFFVGSAISGSWQFIDHRLK